jgi:DNA-binding transcriptional LysR family regulator
MLDWNDLRYVLAVARAGGLAGAAETLAVDPSTVFRRLNAVEARLGARLFERGSGGYLPTSAGERMVQAAERMEREAIEVDRDLTGRDTRLAGRLRITSSETLAYRLLTRHLAAFRESHPGISLELIVDNRLLSLSRREADVALRPTRPDQDDLFGRKLADIAWTVYGTHAYLKQHGRPRGPTALTGHALVGWDEAATRTRAAEWLDATAPADAVVYRSSSLINQLVAVKAGIGLAILPCYLCDPEPDLERCFAPVAELARELWIVTHRDLRNTARVRAFLEIVGDGVLRDKPLLEGRGTAVRLQPGSPARRRAPAAGYRTRSR